MAKTLRTSGNYTIKAGDGYNGGSGANTITLDSLDVTVAGNLTVNGASQVVSTTNTTIEDNIIELNTGATANTNSSGIIIERGTAGNNAAILWKEDTDSFVVGTTTATAADKSSAITVAAGALETAALTATTGTFSSSLSATTGTFSSTLAVTGTSTFSDGVTAESIITNSIVSNGSNADLSIQPSGTGDVLISALRVNGTTLDSSDSTAININESLVVDGTATVSGALSSATSLALASGATVTGIADEDNMSSNSATLLATQQSIKAYVDAEVTAQDLDFQADSGGALAIDLDSETMTFTGGTGIDTSGSGNAVTFAIDSTVVTLAGSQTLTNKTITSPTISTPTVTGTLTATSVTANDITSNGSNADLTISPQGTGSVVISQVSTNSVTGEVIPGKIAGTNFTDSLLVGHATTGTLSSAGQNTGVGLSTLAGITSGDYNTAVGYQAGASNTSATGNTFIGALSGANTTSTGTNTGVGYRTLWANAASGNSAIGYYSGRYNSSGTGNVSMGREALQGVSGNNNSFNTALGAYSNTAVTTGGYNVTLGYQSGDNITTGSGNVIIGSVDAAAVDSARTLKITGNDGSTSTTWIQGDNTGLVTIAGGIVVDNGIDIGIAKLDDGSVTHASSSGVQELDRFVAATYRGGKYVISVSDSANTRFETIELLITHDGTNAYLHSSGVSSSGTSMVTFTTDISDSDVRILMVPISSDSTVYKFVKTLIEV
jgi:hypothetical protein